MTNYAQILETNYPGAEWGIVDNDYSTLDWFSDSPKPTKAALEKQAADVDYKVALQKCQEDRRAAYTLESDPLNFKWQETQNDADRTAWLSKKAEIQARYPEPTPPVK